MPILYLLLGSLFGVGGSLLVQELTAKTAPLSPGPEPEPEDRVGRALVPKDLSPQFLVVMLDEAGDVQGAIEPDLDAAITRGRALATNGVPALVLRMIQGRISKQEPIAVFQDGTNGVLVTPLVTF